MADRYAEPLTPLLPGDIRIDRARSRSQHRFRGMTGAQRWYREMGGRCICTCRRPEDANVDEEAGHPGETKAQKIARRLADGWKPCECSQCGFWTSEGPEQGRVYFGCTSWIRLDSTRCIDCPDVSSHGHTFSGRRTTRAA